MATQLLMVGAKGRMGLGHFGLSPEGQGFSHRGGGGQGG